MNINEEQAFDIAVENELIAFRKRQYSQTRNIPENNFHDGFNRGWEANTKWQEQQSANEAIEFAIWTHQNLWACLNNEPMWYNKNRVYQYKTECLTTQQLYELWQESKNK